jgi:hypothetical protein
MRRCAEKGREKVIVETAWRRYRRGASSRERREKTEAKGEEETGRQDCERCEELVDGDDKAVGIFSVGDDGRAEGADSDARFPKKKFFLGFDSDFSATFHISMGILKIDVLSCSSFSKSLIF